MRCGAGALVIATLAFGPFACEGDVSDSDGAPLGDDCETSDDCSSGVCWDFTDHDPACAAQPHADVAPGLQVNASCGTGAEHGCVACTCGH